MLKFKKIQSDNSNLVKVDNFGIIIVSKETENLKMSQILKELYSFSIQLPERKDTRYTNLTITTFK